jgi:hypothetical protein
VEPEASLARHVDLLQRPAVDTGTFGQYPPASRYLRGGQRLGRIAAELDAHVGRVQPDAVPGGSGGIDVLLDLPVAADPEVG